MVMTVIKVTCGGCGIQYIDANGNARHALKTPESGPFECDVDQAKRLIDLGVAELVPPWTIHGEPAPQEGTDEPSQETEKPTAHLDAEELETWDYNDLKKLAADMGVTPAGKKKADYIAALVAADLEIGDEDEDEDLPDLGVADPE